MKEYQHFTALNETIHIPKSILKKETFFSQKFIWISGVFKKHVFPEIKDEIQSADYTLTALKLDHPLSDDAVRRDLGEDEFVSPHEWAQEMCALIKEQNEGQHGPLLTNECGNIRYVKLSNGNVLSIIVAWDDEDKRWNCIAHELDHYDWDADFRFFVGSFVFV